ncbi:MAG: hypothetical protein JW932_10125 [Deltaproteobacteria bacterium]|nr:hypothetical protein [Deltaproteobacteria bacterium]
MKGKYHEAGEMLKAWGIEPSIPILKKGRHGGKKKVDERESHNPVTCDLDLRGADGLLLYNVIKQGVCDGT